MKIIAGLDGGGTKTRILIESLDGSFSEEKGFGAFNLNGIGVEAFQNLLEDITAYLDSKGECIALCIGASGISNKKATSMIKEHFSSSPIKNWKLVGDHIIALHGALNGKEGIIVVCGTGSVTVGRNAKGEYARSGGWGHLIGDEGSGYGLGRDAFFAITKDIDGYGKKTLLTSLVGEKLNLRSRDDIISYVYSGDKSAVAALSPIVEEAFLAGDSIAADIIKKNACCIVDNIECVVGKLQLTFGRVALHGGVVNNETCMRREIISLMKKRLPYFSCIHPEKDALHGALMMAREMVKGETT